MLNIHPALLPQFKGLHTHRRALAAGVRRHGATVHFVVPEMDSGPIVAQESVPVLEGDTEETLAARVLEVEHRIYPQALARLGRRAGGAALALPARTAQARARCGTCSARDQSDIDRSEAIAFKQQNPRG